jgi:integrase
MAKAITDLGISAAAKQAANTAKRVEMIDATQPGLRLRLSPNGTKTWLLAMRDTHGRMRRFTLGSHPVMTISAAREAARAMRAEVRGGADPVQEARDKRAVAKAAKEGTGTLSALLDLYGHKDGGKLKSWDDCRRRIESVFKPLLKRPLETLRAKDFQMLADGWASEQSAAAAVRYVRPMLKWAAASGRGYVGKELADLNPPATVGRRKRVLSREELAAVLPFLRPQSGPYGACLRFILLTVARRSEADKACWRDVDMAAKTWAIDDPKNGQTHVVPLPRQALELLAALRPAKAKPGDLIFCTRTGGRLMNWHRETVKIHELTGTGNWQRHDLRRTGATLLGEMGEMPDIIEAALNHVNIHSALAANYNQSRYRPQVTVALQRLADALDGIETGGAKIVPIGRGRS